MFKPHYPLPLKIISFSSKGIQIAMKYGWLPGARYTNLRDIRKFSKVGIIDIDWKTYNFNLHLETIRRIKPFFTVARDLDTFDNVEQTLIQAGQLAKYCEFVIIVPKLAGIIEYIKDKLENNWIFGYSMPSIYGNTRVPLEEFKNYPVHLLGGRPDAQAKIATKLNVISFDGNRITYDAKYGDYFDGEIFRPHPKGGLYNCINDSIKNINLLWNNYYCEDGIISNRFIKWMKN